MTVSRAGKKHLTAGTVTGGAATALFYICWQIQYLPLSVLAMVVAGFCASVGAIVWGGTVAPRLANSQFQRQFRRRPGPEVGHALGVPAQLPEPGSTS